VDGPVHGFLGLDIGMVLPNQNDPVFKRSQYACDITYGTNNEFGFDYLRDNMALSRGRQVQRGHNYASSTRSTRSSSTRPARR
jgi:preprotein translocase subunit SecA